MIQPVTIAIIIAFAALIVATFTFGISLFIARTLGRRLQREVYVGYIHKKYCDIRQLSIIKHILPLPLQLRQPFSRCIKDANDVFQESLRYPDTPRLKQSDAALDAILNDMLALLKQFDVPHGFTAQRSKERA